MALSLSDLNPYSWTYVKDEPELFSTVINGTTYYLEDEAVESFALIKTSVVTVITASYLAFSLKYGISYMANRKPMNLKRIMIVYNIFQIFINALGLYTFLFTNGVVQYYLDNWCHAKDHGTNPLRIRMVRGLVLYTFIKYLDLIDTVFMVLRKKNSQISNLHLFHHTAMVLTAWVNAKYLRDEASLVFGVINAFIHVLMYTYYLLSNLGPDVQKIILPFKKYITRMQIGQFVIVLSLLLYTAIQGCTIHPMMRYVVGINVSIFLFLFVKFYKENYMTPKAKIEKKTT